jgi:endonuclease/exonuclease/phosphatase family metal-dependent hydrolase
MKFVSYNIQYGFGADGRYDLARAADVIAGADVIALQEVERSWQRSGSDDQPELLSRLLPHHHAVYGPAFDMDASTVGADGKVVNRRRQFGTMLLSRFPILWSRLHLLPMRKVVRPLNTQNAALEGSGPYLLHPSVAHRRRGAARADRLPQGAASARSARRRAMEWCR